MSVEAINVTGSTLQQMPRAADTIDAKRKEVEKGGQNVEAVSSSENNAVQPEELLSQIKALTEGGLYSVRFENSDEFNELVVKVVNTETGDVIRQVPAEEVLGMKASLEELRGQLVDTVL